MVRSTGCSCQEPGFSSQHLHGDLQLPVILVPGGLIHFSGHYNDVGHLNVYTIKCRQNTYTYKIISKKKKKGEKKGKEQKKKRFHQKGIPFFKGGWDTLSQCVDTKQAPKTIRCCHSQCKFVFNL